MEKAKGKALVVVPIECQNKSDPGKPNPDMSAKTQGFPAERCIVTRRSVLLTSPISGFNVVAYRCILFTQME